MPENRRELGRATVEVKGRVYGMIVYETSFDDLDDETGFLTERCAVYGPEREIPEPGWEENSPWGPRGDGDIIGYTRDGGRREREWKERALKDKEERKREKAERQAKVTPETPRVTKFKHEECDHTGDADEFDERAYECSRCSQVYRGEDGRKCPDCGIFTAKLADRSCPSCEQAVEEGDLIEVVGVEVDGHFVPEAELA